MQGDNTALVENRWRTQLFSTEVRRIYLNKPGIRLKGRQRAKTGNSHLPQNGDISWSTLETCRENLKLEKRIE